MSVCLFALLHLVGCSANQPPQLNQLDLKNGPVYCLAYQPNGNQLAVGVGSQLIVLEKNQESRLFEYDALDHGRVIRCVYTKHSEMLLSAFEAGHVKGFDTKTWKEAFAFDIPGGVYSMDLSADGEVLALGCGGGKIVLWSLEKRVQKATIRVSEAVLQSIRFDSQKKLLVTGGTDGRVSVVDVERQTLVKEFRVKKNEDASISCVEFGPQDDEIVASCLNHGLVVVWNLTTGREKLRMTTEFTNVHSFVLTQDRKALVAACSQKGREKYVGGGVVVWNTKTGKEIVAFPCHLSGVLGLAFSSDWKQLATAGRDSKVSIWDIHKVMAKEN